jgi:hypothetical protein
MSVLMDRIATFGWRFSFGPWLTLDFLLHGSEFLAIMQHP